MCVCVNSHGPGCILLYILQAYVNMGVYYAMKDIRLLTFLLSLQLYAHYMHALYVGHLSKRNKNSNIVDCKGK